MAEGEGDLLGRGRTGLPHVVARDRDRVPVGQVLRAVGEKVGDQTHRRLGRKDVRSPGRVLLEDVVLDCARDLLRRASLLLGHQLIKKQEHGGGRVDRHRRGNLLERDVLEQDLHVLERVDRHTHLADLAVGHGIVRVVADLGGQVEGDRQPGLALLQKKPVALVGFGRSAEPGVLAHRPQASAIHVLVDAARERERPWRRFLGTPILD